MNLLTDTQPLQVSAAIKGISLIGAVTPLPLPEKQSGDTMDIDGILSLNCFCSDSPYYRQTLSSSSLLRTICFLEDATVRSKDYVTNTMVKLLKSAHTRAKTREDAAVCLGYLAIGDGKFFAASNLKSFLGMLRMVQIFKKIQFHLHFIIIFFRFAVQRHCSEHSDCPGYCLYGFG